MLQESRDRGRCWAQRSTSSPGSNCSWAALVSQVHRGRVTQSRSSGPHPNGRSSALCSWGASGEAPRTTVRIGPGGHVLGLCPGLGPSLSAGSVCSLVRQQLRLAKLGAVPSALLSTILYSNSGNQSTLSDKKTLTQPWERRRGRLCWVIPRQPRQHLGLRKASPGAGTQWVPRKELLGVVGAGLFILPAPPRSACYLLIIWSFS